MREIKFRAWNTITKTMIDLKKLTPLALNMDTDGLFIPFSDGLPLMQYTGLKDKNGREIYEGDVVRSFDRKTEYREQVQWGTEGWLPFSQVCHGGTTSWEEYEYEVIGNIYENPDLLAKEE